jgi:hypothetical protein
MNPITTTRADGGRASLLDVVVEILQWPQDSDREAVLASEGQPRLLLVAPDASPPSDWDRLVDWIRLPASHADILARVAMLQRRVGRRPTPRIDDLNMLWRGSDWVALPPTEARLLVPLLDQAGTVLSRRILAAAWPSGVRDIRTVDTYVGRLRSRIDPLGLVIHTVRSRGYFLEILDNPAR